MRFSKNNVLHDKILKKNDCLSTCDINYNCTLSKKWKFYFAINYYEIQLIELNLIDVIEWNWDSLYREEACMWIFPKQTRFCQKKLKKINIINQSIIVKKMKVKKRWLRIEWVS